MGAANVATLRLLLARGVKMEQIIATDSRGILHRDRADVAEQQVDYPDKWRLCLESNVDDVRGGIAEAMRGADVCIAFARPGPDLIKPEWVSAMAKDSIVFPCSNPVPEMWPWDAKEAGARIVGTGRSDFANQLNNSLGFPAIFRGALDVRARTITDEMCLSAADEIARYGEELGLDDEHIVPDMSHLDLFPREAVAVGMKAIEQGLAGLTPTREELLKTATEKINSSREMIDVLMREGCIAPVPEE
jgi:malate dehydrogenase (oxaloacetate-decarboxylating)